MDDPQQFRPQGPHPRGRMALQLQQFRFGRLGIAGGQQLPGQIIGFGTSSSKARRPVRTVSCAFINGK